QSGGYAVLPEGVIRVSGVGGISSNGNTAASYRGFAPRVGLAYQLSPKTVVRLGYGRSFDIGVFGSNFGHTVTQNLPVLANQSLNSIAGDDRTAAFNFANLPLPASGGYNPAIAGPAAPQTVFPAVPSDGILPLWGVCADPGTSGGTCAGNVSPHLRPDK